MSQPAPRIDEPHRNQPKAPSKKTQETPKSDQRGTNDSPLIVETHSAPKTKDEAAEYAKQQEEKAGADRWSIGTGVAVAIAAFLQFIALIVQAYWLGRTVKVSETAAKAARESADAVASQLRAYVMVESAKAFWGDNGGLAFVVIAKNSGQTPAFGFWFVCGIAYATSHEMIPPHPHADRAEAILAPGGTFQHDVIVPHLLTAEERNNIARGTHKIFVYGRMTYSDVFGNDRFTEFCMETIAVGQDGLRACAKGNKAN